jgi:hypothetical protein
LVISKTGRGEKRGLSIIIIFHIVIILHFRMPNFYTYRGKEGVIKTGGSVMVNEQAAQGGFLTTLKGKFQMDTWLNKIRASKGIVPFTSI